MSKYDYVHRDISPGNLFWNKSCKTGQLGDLEYMRHMSDPPKGNVKTVSPNTFPEMASFDPQRFFTYRAHFNSWPARYSFRPHCTSNPRGIGLRKFPVIWLTRFLIPPPNQSLHPFIPFMI
jgi:hypothetical protein